MFKLRKQFAAAFTVLAVAVLAACGGGGSSPAPTSGTGNLRVALTDAPSCGYSAVNVTVQKVRVHQSASASDSDPGWSEVVLNPAQRVDLLTLTNGVLSELGQTPLAAGKYTQMRLVLASNDSANPMANSVVPDSGTETALTTPSAQQSGLKMNVDIDIAPGKLADFVLDFDACKSIVRAGNSGRYLLKPVVRVIPRYISGVAGFVDATLANGNTSVTLQQGGQVVRSSVPDSSGQFLLRPVAPGTYDLVITAPGRVTEVVTGVPVASDSVTAVNSSTSLLSAPSSATGVAGGSVTTGVSPIDATVRATQVLGNGEHIEVASGPVDSSNGSYSFTLPTAATQVAAYAAAPATLSFAADAATAGKYVVEASSNGTVKSAGPITLSAGGTATTNFTFP